MISLTDIGAGPNRQVSVGDVLVAENASIRGKVLRSELSMVPSGHRDTVAFVPEGPFVAYSADDGSFAFNELPEGAIELGFFRSGYKPIVLPALQVQGGEQLTLRDVILEQDGDMRPAPSRGPSRSSLSSLTRPAPPFLQSVEASRARAPSLRRERSSSTR